MIKDEPSVGQWKPIATAPKRDVIDLWAKSWNAEDDSFSYRRFTNCKYQRDDDRWDIPFGWHPTHWMPIPEGPR